MEGADRSFGDGMLHLILPFLGWPIDYSIEREHVGLRRIAGYGVTVTRVAASAMMFTYSSQLVTMCRNLITKLRETPLNHIVPVDAAHSSHIVRHVLLQGCFQDYLMRLNCLESISANTRKVVCNFEVPQDWGGGRDLRHNK